MFSLLGIALVTQSYRNACKESSDPKFSFYENQDSILAITESQEHTDKTENKDAPG